ncbi:hypothetical protein vseg_003291 [Gypsophila vaccaria]
MDHKKPCFYQIVIDDFIAHRVRIPPLFMKHIRKDMSNEETREGRIKSGDKLWGIKLRKTSKGTYIDDGWTQVMHDNNLGDKEFLVFKYDGDLCFTLHIFENSGCERIYSTCLPKQCYKSGDNHNHNHFGNAEVPQSYYFAKSMKECHVKRSFLLRLPKDFSARLCPATPERMTKIELENSKGEIWKVNASLNTGSYCLCGGWRFFVLANNINPGDVCKFELVTPKRIKLHHYKA